MRKFYITDSFQFHKEYQKVNLLSFYFNVILTFSNLFAAFILEDLPIESRIGIAIKGAFLGEHYNDLATNTMTIFLSLIHQDGNEQVGFSINKKLNLKLIRICFLFLLEHFNSLEHTCC